MRHLGSRQPGIRESAGTGSQQIFREMIARPFRDFHRRRDFMLKQHPRALKTGPQRAGRAGGHGGILFLVRQTANRQLQAEKIDRIISQNREIPAALFRVGFEAGAPDDFLRQGFDDDEPQI